MSGTFFKPEKSLRLVQFPHDTISLHPSIYDLEEEI